LVKEQKPEIIIYENTTYIYGRQHQGTVGLYKLIGGIMALKYIFDFIHKIDSVAVNQVKLFKNKLFSGQEKIESLTCKVGR
ncbi:29431_t:CDS:1, partial [Racocetra persica]